MKVINILCSIVATSAVLGGTSTNHGADAMIEVYMNDYGPLSITIGPQGNSSVVEIPGIDVSAAMILSDDFIHCYFIRLKDEDISDPFSSAKPLTNDFDAADRLHCVNNESEVDGKKVVLLVKTSRPFPEFITMSLEPQHDLSYVDISGMDISGIEIFTGDALCFLWRETVDFSRSGSHADFVSAKFADRASERFLDLGVDRLYCVNRFRASSWGDTFLLLVENEARDQELVWITVPSGQADTPMSLSPASYPEVFEKASRVALMTMPSASSICALKYHDRASPPGILSYSSPFLFFNLT